MQQKGHLDLKNHVPSRLKDLDLSVLTLQSKKVRSLCLGLLWACPSYVLHWMTVKLHTQITYGDRAFPVAGRRLWNSLPHVVMSAPTLAVFRKRLKTYLFSHSFAL